MESSSSGNHPTTTPTTTDENQNPNQVIETPVETTEPIKPSVE